MGSYVCVWCWLYEYSAPARQELEASLRPVVNTRTDDASRPLQIDSQNVPKQEMKFTKARVEDTATGVLSPRGGGGNTTGGMSSQASQASRLAAMASPRQVQNNVGARVFVQNGGTVQPRAGVQTNVNRQIPQARVPQPQMQAQEPDDTSDTAEIACSRFCPMCGKQRTPGWRFCDQCGNPFPA